jgi:hypothetical protein
MIRRSSFTTRSGPPVISSMILRCMASLAMGSSPATMSLNSPALLAAKMLSASAMRPSASRSFTLA